MQSLALELAAPAIRLVLWFAPLFMAVGAGLLGASILQRRSKSHSAVEAAASERGLVAEVRDLLKEVLADVEIVEDASFKRRADRALAEYDGVVEPWPGHRL